MDAEQPLQPDEVIMPGGGRLAQPWAREAFLALPNLVKLLYRLIKDPRVSPKSKVLVTATLGYVVSPIDLLPDFIPVIGQTDDLLLVAYALNQLIRTAGEEVVLEHWDGSQDLLGIVAASMEFGSKLLPKPLQRILDRI